VLWPGASRQGDRAGSNVAKNAFKLAAVSGFENERTTGPRRLSAFISITPNVWLNENAYFFPPMEVQSAFAGLSL
jgi:hypothetical protein